MEKTTFGSIACITRECYMKSPSHGMAANIAVNYSGNDMTRFEIATTQASSDWMEGSKIRYSSDNGKTWGEWTILDKSCQKRNNLTMSEVELARCYDSSSQKMVRAVLQRILVGNPQEALAAAWRGIERYYDHMFWQVSGDNGYTWGKIQQLCYEGGSLFNSDNWEDEKYFAANWMDGGLNICLLGNGNIVYTGQIRTLHKDADGNEEKVDGTICFIGNWNSQKGSYDWKVGQPVTVSKKISSRGLQEACIIELATGRILLEMRGSSTDITPGRRWISLSDDGGLSWSPVTDLRYDDGQQFYSPATFARIIRSSKTGKLYWVGNICKEPPAGSLPRYPLYIAEMNEDIPALKKNTLTVIDGYDHGKDSSLLQLTNFCMLENRESHDIEIYLTRLGEMGKGTTYDEDFWTANAYKYTVHLF